LACGSGPPPTSGPNSRPASGPGVRPASWAGVASDFRSGPPSTSTSGPPLGSEVGGGFLRLGGPPSPGRGSAFVPTSGKRSTGGVTWRSGSRAGSLWVGRPGSVAARGGSFPASRPGMSVEPDGGEGGGWRSGAAGGGSVGGCATNGLAAGVEGEGGVEPPSSPGSASSRVSGSGGSGGSGWSGWRRPGRGVGSVVLSTHAPSCGPPGGRRAQPIGAGALPRRLSTTCAGPIPPTAPEG
jgi:hypothetical protein